MKSLLTVFLSLLLAVSCASAPKYTLEPYATEENELIVDRGRAALSASDGEVSILSTCFPVPDEDVLCLVMSITNTSDARYFFEDSQLEILYGDLATDAWASSGRWDADAFYSDAMAEARRRQDSAAAFGAIAVVSSGIRITASQTARRPGLGPRNGYNPAADALLTGMIVSNELEDTARSNRDYLDFLGNNLLFSSHIAPGETYSGVFYIPADWSFPERKIVFHSKDGRQLPFIFSRVEI